MSQLSPNLLQEVAPLILFDSNEPFLFTEVAISVIKSGGKSPSSDHILKSPGANIIEYALWSDLEIGHSNELEHIWVHLDSKHKVVKVEGSAHGLKIPLKTPVKNERPIAYSEPGKHGMASAKGEYLITKNLITTLCMAAAGNMGVLSRSINGELAFGVENHRKAWNYLREKSSPLCMT
jgi:hypothetical protein